jgi:F-box-like
MILLLDIGVICVSRVHLSPYEDAVKRYHPLHTTFVTSLVYSRNCHRPSSSNMESLPVEILTAIADQLDQESLAVLSRVSSQFYHVTAFVLYSAPCLVDPYPDAVGTQSLQRLYRFACTILHHRDRAVQVRRLEFLQEKQLDEYQTSLTSFHTVAYTRPGRLTLDPSPPDYSGSSDNSTTQHLVHAAGTCHLMSLVNITNWQRQIRYGSRDAMIALILAYMPRLEFLKIHAENRLPIMIEALNALPFRPESLGGPLRLTEIHFERTKSSHTDPITVPSSGLIPLHIQTLRLLYLSNWRIHSAHLQVVAPWLRSLCLFGCALSQNVLEGIPSVFPNLEVLVGYGLYLTNPNPAEPRDEPFRRFDAALTLAQLPLRELTFTENPSRQLGYHEVDDDANLNSVAGQTSLTALRTDGALLQRPLATALPASLTWLWLDVHFADLGLAHQSIVDLLTSLSSVPNLESFTTIVYVDQPVDQIPGLQAAASLMAPLEDQFWTAGIDFSFEICNLNDLIG